MTIQRDNELRTSYRQSTRGTATFKPIQIDDFTPLITDKDVTNGSITRYFTRSANNFTPAEIVEISKTVYDGLKTNNFYTVTSLKWLIRGPVDTTTGLTEDNQPIILQYGVIDANQKSITIADKYLPGLALVVTNYVRFYQGL